jgi:DNA damage-binding protein 1
MTSQPSKASTSNALLRAAELTACSKSNRLEIWRVANNNQIAMLMSRSVHGTISMLQRLRPKDSDTDLLFVGTDRHQYFTLAWDEEKQQLDTKQTFEDQGERHMRDAQSEDRCLVDPTGRYMALHLWEGVLSVFRLASRKVKGNTLQLEELEQVRLTELFIKASTFLYTETGHPKIALLYQTRSDSLESKLATYRLTEDDRNTRASKFDPLKDREIDMPIADAGASILIPVRKVEEEKRHNVRNPADPKAHLGGLVVVGETRLIYIDETTKAEVESPLKEAAIFVAWAEYDVTHYFLADDYGSMYLLSILCEGTQVENMSVDYIGKTSRAHKLVYLGNDLLFVASHYGDSQLFRIDFSQESSLQYMQLVQTLPNIGPILDFAIMDMGNREGDSQVGNQYSSGQARLVTGSGCYKDGTLRSVRSGVGLEDIGILADLDGVRNMFALGATEAGKADTLVASFLTETRFFKFDGEGEVEEVERYRGLKVDTETLLARQFSDGRLLQVTPDGARLLEAEGGVQLSEWKTSGDQSVTGASANHKWLILSINGKQLVSLDISRDLQVASTRDFGDKDQIACVHASPDLEDIGVVGFWASGTVSLVRLESLEAIVGEGLRRRDDNASIPRDIVLAQVLPATHGSPTLFVAMEDGNVVTFSVSKSDYSLTGRKTVVLGTRHARLTLLPQANGVSSIFATSEHPSLIYGAEGRIVYSAVTAEDAACICPFDAEAFPDCIAVASVSQVKIARIDTERRTHVRPLEMGQTVRRIAYSPAEKAFGLGCIKRELIKGEEHVNSYFQLVDEVIFAPLSTPLHLQSDLSVVELVECVIRAELPGPYGQMVERFIVGTSWSLDPSGIMPGEDTRGRILVIGVDSDRSPFIVHSQNLKGPCRCLAILQDDLIVAALMKTVIVSRYLEESNTSAKLVRIASYRPSTYPVDLAVHGNIIAIADLMKSISLVEYIPATAADKAQLKEVARHYQSAWATAVSPIEDDSWLEGDAQGNLMVLRRNAAGVTEEDKRRLQLTSEINLGEQVNRVRRFNVETESDAMVIPRAFLATVSLASAFGPSS